MAVCGPCSAVSSPVGSGRTCRDVRCVRWSAHAHALFPGMLKEVVDIRVAMNEHTAFTIRQTEEKQRNWLNAYQKTQQTPGGGSSSTSTLGAGAGRGQSAAPPAQRR